VGLAGRALRHGRHQPCHGGGPPAVVVGRRRADPRGARGGSDPRPVHAGRAGAGGGRCHRGRGNVPRSRRDARRPGIGRGVADHAGLRRLVGARGAGGASRGRGVDLGVGADRGERHHRARPAWLRRGDGGLGQLQRPDRGTIFALEVVLRHFAVRAFAPIAIASVAGTVINRLKYGGVTEFTLPAAGATAFHVELPAFLLLGLVSGLIAARSEERRVGTEGGRRGGRCGRRARTK